MGKGCRAVELFQIVVDKPVYHCKAHGAHVAKVAESLGKLLGFPAEEVKVLEAAGLWHDVGMLLDTCINCEEHERIGADYLREVCGGDSTCLKAAEIIKEAPKVIAIETLESTPSLAEALSVADFIAQCAHACYLLMLGKLYETFARTHCARGCTGNQFTSKTALLYDDFIEKLIYPAVRKYLELKGMEEYRQGFELNTQIRQIAREKRTTYRQLDKIVRMEAGIDNHELSWDLPITLEHLETIRQKLDQVA